MSRSVSDALPVSLMQSPFGLVLTAFVLIDSTIRDNFRADMTHWT